MKQLNMKVEAFVDIGCYTGENTLYMAKACNAANVYGVDFNADALKLADQKGVKTINQDINEQVWINVPTDTFDFVYSNQVIEHLYSVDNYIENIKRILKAGGYALISTENLSGWHNCFSLLLGYQPFSTTNICTKKWSLGNPFSVTDDIANRHDPLMIHRSMFTYYALLNFLKLYDFEVVKSINSGYYPLPNNGVGNLMANLDRKHSVYMAVLVKNIK